MAERLNEETFDDFIARSDLPVLADFYRDGCVPCRRVAPLLSKAEAEYGERLAAVRVNIDMNAGLAERYKITAAPTLALFCGGKEIARHRGVIGRDGLKAFIEENLP